MPYKPLTQDALETLKEMYLQGQTLEAIATALDTSRQSVAAHAKKMDLPTRRPQPSDTTAKALKRATAQVQKHRIALTAAQEELDAIIRKAINDDHLTVNMVSAHTGISRWAIQLHLKNKQE